MVEERLFAAREEIMEKTTWKSVMAKLSYKKREYFPEFRGRETEEKRCRKTATSHDKFHSRKYVDVGTAVFRTNCVSKFDKTNILIVFLGTHRRNYWD